MKVILLEDVKSLGKKGDIVDVSDGYADNFLIKKKKGVPASEGNLKNLAHEKKKEAENAAERLDAAKALKEKIERVTTDVSMKAGENGKVFGSVSSKEIAQALLSQHGFEVDKKKITLSEPIKSFGIHEVSCKLHPEVTATVRVQVIGE
ncbi:MAG: 50S ribosomal protein L9 [Lachnospiraceae bacterium]|nr:50S ribosomal protein L9 [Lachnospiraceae bacterium]